LVELLRANDPVLISYLLSVLEDEGVDAVMLDEHTSILEGSIGAIQRRIVVREEHLARARIIVEDVAPGQLAPSKKA
jgi:Putative prokaryotic signal transducing protein